MSYANFVLLLADSYVFRSDVGPPQTYRCAQRYRGKATPYCHHLCYHQHPVYIERGTQQGSKIRENVEEVVGIVGEKLVEVTATFYHSRSSSPVAHLE